MHLDTEGHLHPCKDCELLRDRPGAAAHGALTVSSEGGFDLLYRCTCCGFGWKRYTRQHSLEGQWLVVPRGRHRPLRPDAPSTLLQAMAAAM